MDKVNSAKEMGSIYAGVLMFYVPVLYAIRTRFLKRTKLGIFFWLAEYLFHNHFEYTRFHKNNIHRQLTKALEK